MEPKLFLPFPFIQCINLIFKVMQPISKLACELFRYLGGLLLEFLQFGFSLLYLIQVFHLCTFLKLLKSIQLLHLFSHIFLDAHDIPEKTLTLEVFDRVTGEVLAAVKLAHTAHVLFVSVDEVFDHGRGFLCEKFLCNQVDLASGRLLGVSSLFNDLGLHRYYVPIRRLTPQLSLLFLRLAYPWKLHFCQVGLSTVLVAKEILEQVLRRIPSVFKVSH
jgi:hypothetical protein